MMPWFPSSITFLTLLFILNLMPGLGLKNVRIVLPKPWFRRNSDARLSCDYDLGGEALYAIKFYKGPPPFREFYRYVPKETPPAKDFKLPGVQVDVNLSNEFSVFLKNVSAGTYKCSVAAEFPFETLEATADLKLVVIRDDPPKLRLDRSQYHPGDLVSAECQSPSSFPPANISWFFNDLQGQGRVMKTEERKDERDPVTKFTVSTITFDLPEKETPVKVHCRANVYSEYNRSSDIRTIHPIPPRLTGTETLLRSGTMRASKTSSSLNFFITLMTVLVTIRMGCT